MPFILYNLSHVLKVVDSVITHFIGLITVSYLSKQRMRGKVLMAIT